jgi:hypothetical protein
LIARTVISPFLASPKSNPKIINQVFDQPEQQLLLKLKKLTGHYLQQASCLLQDWDETRFICLCETGMIKLVGDSNTF